MWKMIQSQETIDIYPIYGVMKNGGRWVREQAPTYSNVGKLIPPPHTQPYGNPANVFSVVKSSSNVVIFCDNNQDYFFPKSYFDR